MNCGLGKLAGKELPCEEDCSLYAGNMCLVTIFMMAMLGVAPEIVQEIESPSELGDMMQNALRSQKKG